MIREQPHHTLQPQHKIIISGTGRAGTTFLVRLLTELGLPTGYDRTNWTRDYFSHCSAGLERRATDPDAPYIVKDPDLCVTLPELLATGRIVVDHALVPVRDLDAAALSRVRIGGSDGSVPGGVIGTTEPSRQRAVLAERFHQLVQTLVAHDIPHTFLHFPRFVQDSDYAYARLAAAFPGIARDTFETAFRSVADPQLVHTFAPGAAPRSNAADEYRTAVRRKRLKRQSRRLAGWMAALVLVGAGFGFRPAMQRHVASAAPTTARPSEVLRSSVDRSDEPTRTLAPSSEPAAIADPAPLPSFEPDVRADTALTITSTAGAPAASDAPRVSERVSVSM